MKQNKIDLTHGPIIKGIVLFAAPLCAANILQMLYNTVDTMVIGNFCDASSLAACATSAFPLEAFLCLFMGLGNGVSILIAQYTGERDERAQQLVSSSSVSFLYICAIPLSIAGYFLCPYILRLMNVPPDAWDKAVLYTRIIFMGILPNIGCNINAGIVRGAGDSRAILFVLCASCITNIALDVLFVGKLAMDVMGAAIATIAAISLSWVTGVIYIKRRYPALHFTFFPHTFNKKVMIRILRIGVPLGINNSIYNVGHILLQSLVNAQGSIFMASCAVATKLTGIANMAISSFSGAATTFAGQNIGAHKYARLCKAAPQIVIMSGGVTCTAGFLMLFLCHPLLSLFTHDASVLSFAALYIKVVMPFTWMYAVLSCIISFANGLGEVKFPTIINILMLWAVRIPAGYFIAYRIDGKYLMAAIPLSFAFGMSAMLFFFISPRWRAIKDEAKTQLSSSSCNLHQ